MNTAAIAAASVLSRVFGTGKMSNGKFCDCKLINAK